MWLNGELTCDASICIIRPRSRLAYLVTTRFNHKLTLAVPAFTINLCASLGGF
nr:MAG TPA: hypothetical protein [Caudoviricetes sp.]